MQEQIIGENFPLHLRTLSVTPPAKSSNLLCTVESSDAILMAASMLVLAFAGKSRSCLR